MTPFRSASLLRAGLLLAGLASASLLPPRPVFGQTPPVLVAPAAPLKAPVVPSQLEFANQAVKLTPGGQAAVQKLVDALYRHPAYLAQKVERAGLYFPLIDRVLAEENVPSDFRYLCVQESGLVSDAVSTSNAVGFWQFKEASATELGARVNAQVDERRHLLESTRTAARYLKRSNAQLDNWLNSLLSYNLGLGGAKRLVKPEERGNRQMTITEETHPYVVTFLAHRLAFEGPCRLAAAPALTLQEVKAKPGQTLPELALSLGANPEEVARYNKWLLAPTVPDDKEYTVLVPTPTVTTLAAATLTTTAQVAFPEPRDQMAAPEITQANGLRAVVARRGDSPAILALVAGMDEKRFRFLNDLTNFEGVVEGRPYYLQKKRNKAAAEYHVVQPGETVPMVAQQYGIKARSLWKMNRMERNDLLETGRLLWLQHTRPSSVAIEYVHPKNTPAAQAPATATASAEPLLGGEPVFADTVVTDHKLADLNAGPAPVAAPLPTLVLTPAVAPLVTPPPPATILAPAPNPILTPAPALAEAPPVVVIIETPAPPVAPEVGTATAPQGTQDTSRQISAAPPAGPLKTPAQVATTPATQHTVSKGESLSVISRRYGLTVANLMAWNSLPTPNLRLGQTLRLTAPTTDNSLTSPALLPAPRPDLDSAGATWHTVQAGESLYRISKQYNTTVQTLMQWNAMADFNVKLGQKLVVKKNQ